jgi:hypothetical protein
LLTIREYATVVWMAFMRAEQVFFLCATNELPLLKCGAGSADTHHSIDTKFKRDRDIVHIQGRTASVRRTVQFY